MKKIISTILAVIALAVALTGCNNSTASTTDSSSSNTASGNSGSSDSSSESGSSSSSSESSSSSSSSESSSSSSSSENSSSSSSSESSSSSSSSESSSSSSSSENNSGNIPNDFGLPLPNTRAGELVAKALAADEWGAMIMLSLEDDVPVIFSDKLTADMIEDGCFISNMMNVHLFHVFVAKSKVGSEDAVKSAFDEKFDYFKNDPNAAFYGGQWESIAGGVSGVTDDGYYYIVIHHNGAGIADAMVK